MLLLCSPAGAWLPDARELEELCRLTQWEGQAAPLLEEPDEDIRKWLSTPINSAQDTPVHVCALHGNLGLLARLLSKVPEPHTFLERTSIGGNTPLHRAAIGGHLPVVQYLLAHGARVDAVNFGGLTPLHWAAQNGHLPVVQCLLAHGATVSVVTSDDVTPLHWAARKGHLQVVRYLLAHGARVDAVDFHGLTPLHWAAQGGHPEVVECLLTHGAVAGAVSSCGLTPLYLATINGYQDVIQLLEDPPPPKLTPETLKHLLSFSIWHWVGCHIDRVMAIFADPAHPLPPILLARMLAELGFGQALGKK